MTATETYSASKLAGDTLICDADAHLMETKNWLRDYADPDVRPLLAPMNLEAFPDPTERPDYTPDFYEDGWTDSKVADAEAHLLDRKQWAALGAVDKAERSRVMDALGFHRQFVFATFCWGQFDSLAYAPKASGRDPKALYGGSRAHNRGVAEFCADDSRLRASGMAPLDVPHLAVELVDELLAGGCAGVVIPTGVGGRGDCQTTWSHPDNDPVWARLSEAGVPAVLHIGTGLMEPFPAWLYNNGKRPTYMMAGDGQEGWQVQDLYSNWWTVPLFLQALAIDGVFARHPGLKVAVCEYETGWLPHFMRRIDSVQNTAVRMNPGEYTAPMKASEYLRERVKYAPVPGNLEDWHWVMSSIDGGEELLMFNTDYPHSEGSTDPIAAFEPELAKFGERADAVRQLFYTDNYLAMFGRD